MTLVLCVDESTALRLLKESGAHRWQRVPPTEKRGRIQTSTVTVAAMREPQESVWRLREADIETFIERGSGPGGQHRNNTSSCVVMRHRPTGLSAMVDSRCQHANKRQARAVLEARVAAHYEALRREERNSARRELIGKTGDAERIRTYRESDDRVIDEVSGRKASLRTIERGKLDVLWR